MKILGSKVLILVNFLRLEAVFANLFAIVHDIKMELAMNLVLLSSF